MDYEKFENEMNDIMGSGYGSEFTDWHKDQLTQLFDYVNKDLLFEYVNSYYSNNSIDSISSEELNFVANYLKADLEVTISFNKR